MEKFIVCLFTALSTFLPSCSIENNQTYSEEMSTQYNTEKDNPENDPNVKHFPEITIDSSYFNHIIQNPNIYHNFTVIPVDTLTLDLNTWFKKKSSILENYILTINEEGCFSLQKKDPKTPINDSNIRLASVLFYVSKDMDPPFFVTMNVGNLDTHRLAAYAQYIPDKNTENSSYIVHLVFVGNTTQIFNDLNSANPPDKIIRDERNK